MAFGQDTTKDYPGKVADNTARNAPPFPNISADTDQPKSSKYWLDELEQSEKAFTDWNAMCDNIDKLISDMSRLNSNNRDKEYQMFWANLQTMGPAIYARPPIPVVVPKFKDRRPIYQVSSEVMERCAVVAFDLTAIDDIMKLVRDDVITVGRGCAWARYSGPKGSRTERVILDYKPRKDFRHQVARSWPEVGWVAAASYLTLEAAKKRFEPTSGDAYTKITYNIDRDSKDIGGADDTLKAQVWEIWSKEDNKVCWVAEGSDVLLDEADPHMEFEEFFPCPKPAYSATQRGSLVPMPDVLYYKDQLDEINLLTARIHGLSDALEAKGFYPAGGAELGDAVEAAVKMKASGRILVPISNWAAFGGTKEIIVWLPIDMIATVIQGLVALRKEIIQDIYQLIGLSDIMRGATDPQETLGAQRLKSQYGSVRVRDKQDNLAKFARDCVRKTVEIITEKFQMQTILQMCQMQLPFKAQIAQQINQIQTQITTQTLQFQAMQNAPQARQMAQQNPQAVQQIQSRAHEMLSGAQQLISQLKQQPTVEDIMKFIRDNRARAFVLDIETDSTIQQDEDAEKQRRAEFMQVLSQLLPQLAQMVGAMPQTAPFCGELLKFAVAPYRAGRSLDGAIDQLVMQLEGQAGNGQQAQQGQQNVEAMKANVEQQKLQFEQQKLAWQSAENDKDRQVDMAKINVQSQADQTKFQGEQVMAAANIQNDRAQGQAKIAQTVAQADAKRQQQQFDMQIKANESQSKIQIARETAASRQASMAQMAQRRAAPPQGSPLQGGGTP